MPELADFFEKNTGTNVKLFPSTDERDITRSPDEIRLQFSKKF